MNAGVRFIILVVIGAMLAPLTGYFAGLLFGPALVVWFCVTLFGAFTGGAKGLFVMLAVPGMIGASWAWPVTCLMFPVTALFIRGSALTPLLFAAIGAAAGAAVAYAWIATGLQVVHASEIGSYLAGGAIGCLVVGAIFGFALWRIDRLASLPGVADVK